MPPFRKWGLALGVLVLITLIIYTTGEQTTSVDEQDVCDGISDEWLDYCYQTAAETRNDSMYCSYITSNRTQSECYGTLAVQTRTIELCERVTYSNLSRDYCYEQVLEQTGDVQACEFVEIGYRTYSFTVINRTEETDCLVHTLSALDSAQRQNICTSDECWLVLAVLEGNESFCEQTGMYEQACNQEIITRNT